MKYLQNILPFKDILIQNTIYGCYGMLDTNVLYGFCLVPSFGEVHW